MKQNITAKQLNELSKKGRRKGMDYCYDKGWTRCIENRTKWDMELLSIGQMIEFLSDHRPYMLGLHQFNLWETNKLADALWEAVKEVLNERS